MFPSKPNPFSVPQTVPQGLPLVQALLDYEALGRRRFHVPGHAGQPLVETALGLPVPGLGPEAYRYDQTEVEGLDVLSEATECLAAAQAEAATAFGVAQSFFLVNGSTVGLQAAMLVSLKPGDRVLLPRNVHRSVLSGCILTGAEPVWFLPPWDATWGLWHPPTAQQVESLLTPDIRALILTSPTYEGLGVDLAAMSALCRERGVLLIIDEAHGSLWPFWEALPPSACGFPVDAVIHSLHKSAGSLTQSAMAHLPHGSRIPAEDFQQALNTLQTTSPSYLLMASLDATRGFLASPAAQGVFASWWQTVTTLRQRLQDDLTGFELFVPPEATPWDPSRLYLRSRYEAGEAWACRVEATRQIAYEATNAYATLYIAGLGLRDGDYDFFRQALQAEDAAYGAMPPTPYQPTCPAVPLPEMVLLPRDAFFAPGESVSAQQAVGRVAKETLVHCPPGIPVLMPGERIQPVHTPFLPPQVLVVR